MILFICSLCTHTCINHALYNYNIIMYILYMHMYKHCNICIEMISRQQQGVMGSIWGDIDVNSLYSDELLLVTDCGKQQTL